MAFDYWHTVEVDAAIALMSAQISNSIMSPQTRAEVAVANARALVEALKRDIASQVAEEAQRLQELINKVDD